MYKIRIDRPRTLVTLTATGTIDEAELASAARAVAVAIKSLGDRVKQHVILYDFTAAQIVSEGVLTNLSAYFSDPVFATTWGRRAAFVSRSAMITFQVGSIRAATIETSVFNDRRQARKWLLADTPGRIAA